MGKMARFVAKEDKDPVWKHVAMSHGNTLGAGAKKRKHLRAKKKIGVVMSEYKRGTLHSGSGAIAKKKSQAVAIAMSEAGMSKRKRKK